MLALGEQIHSSKLITIFFFIKKKKVIFLCSKIAATSSLRKISSHFGNQEKFSLRIL